MEAYDFLRNHKVREKDSVDFFWTIIEQASPCNNSYGELHTVTCRPQL